MNLIPGDDIVLQVAVQLDKVGGVAGNADNQIPVFFRRFLGGAERFRVHHVVLDFHAAFFKIRLRHIAKFRYAVLPAENGGVQPHIQRQAPGETAVVEADFRTADGGGAVFSSGQLVFRVGKPRLKKGEVRAYAAGEQVTMDGRTIKIRFQYRRA